MDRLNAAKRFGLRRSPSFPILYTYQQIQQNTSCVVPVVFVVVKLNIHKGKFEILKRNTVSANGVTFDGEALKEVETFTFLGSITHTRTGSDAGKVMIEFLQLKSF